ncbi:MAG: hypothetical protein R3F43_00100 [bacterium]
MGELAQKAQVSIEIVSPNGARSATRGWAMNICIGSRWVGKWSYLLPEDEHQDDPLRQWERLTPAALAVFDRLFSDRLLQCPLFLTLWEIGRPPQFTRSVVEQWKFVTPTISSLLTGVRQWGTLDIHGSSVIASPLGERALQGVLGLTVAAESFGNSISIWTRSDVWMPYDLQARPHPEVAALNAPRLKAALEAVERMLGVTALSEDTRFAKVDGYELRNHTAFGDVLDLQDMGYDESWIAERWPDPDPVT